MKIKLKAFYKEDGSIDLESWLQNILQLHQAKNPKLIRDAAIMAGFSGEEQATPYGDSCLAQGLMMAEILSQLNIDDYSIAAAIAYSSVQYADLNLEDVEEQLGPKASKLIQHTQQLASISDLYASSAHHEQHHPKIDNLRKMLLAMVDDIRAVLIKLAERLAVMRTVKLLDENTRIRVAQETAAIYAPLANRLGLGQIKWELEDFAFRYLEAEKYKQISQSLNQRRTDREVYIKNFIQQLNQMLDTAEIHDYQIQGRAKHIYSIYRKMQRKDVDIKQIYDALAVRVLVNSIEDCYKVLSTVHGKWEHIPQEFDDYIATPKPNGYKSVHTAIIGPDQKNVEIQIRTHEMHQESELGVAAHWVYKEGSSKSSDYESKIAWLRQVMDWQQEVSQTEHSLENAHKIFEDRVYVFTPNGDIMDLPTGATSLDFAYHIHSELGHRCRGAKVNNNIVTLTYKLQTGDRVDIITTKHGRPSRDWLNSHLGFVKTSRAKAKIHQWFKKQNYENNVVDGQQTLEKEFRRLGLKNINIASLADKLHCKSTEDLYASLGSGDIKISSVINVIPKEKPTTAEEITTITPPIKATAATPQRPTDINIQGVGNLLTHIANCCKPVPGDAIIGYITQGRGISIHRQDCPNILRTNTQHPEKLIAVHWGEKTAQNYPVNLAITAYDRTGLVKDISNIISNEHLNLQGLTCNVDKNDHLTYINLTVEISCLESLSKILTKISQLQNVIEAKRV